MPYDMDKKRMKSSRKPMTSAEDINMASAAEQNMAPMTGTDRGMYMGIPNVKKIAFDPNNLKTTAFRSRLTD